MPKLNELAECMQTICNTSMCTHTHTHTHTYRRKTGAIEYVKKEMCKLNELAECTVCTQTHTHTHIHTGERQEQLNTSRKRCAS